MKSEEGGIKCEKDYQEDGSSKDDEDYIPSDKKEFEFLNANEDEQIDSLQGDACLGQILDGAAYLENKWKLNDNEYDIDVEGNETSSNSDGGDEDESKRDLKKYKKKIVDPTTDFNCKTFKVSVDGSIKFIKCQVFLTVTYFRNVLREYEVKYRYHLKKYINWKENIRTTCMGDGCM